MTTAYFRLILRRFGTSAAKRAALLAGTRFTVTDDEISVATQLRQLANLDRLAPAGWGLAIGGALDGVAHGPAGEAIVTAPTLGAALEVLATYATVRAPFIDLRAGRTTTRFELEVVARCELGQVSRPIFEMVLASTQWVVESALGRRMREAVFTMPAPRPEYARKIARAFHAPVAFRGRRAMVSLPARWLDLPCPLADRAVHRAALARLETSRNRLAGDHADAEVEHLLDLGADAGATLAETAKRLRVSPRTLVRRLGRRHASFRALLDEHRRRRAAELLARIDLSIEEVADRLGYEESASFRRACRRWFGRSPRAVRDEL